MKKLIIILCIASAGIALWVYLNYRQNLQDQVTTNDIFVSDEDLEDLTPLKEIPLALPVIKSPEVKQSNGNTSFTAKVVSFIDECADYFCPDGASCEPCHSSITVQTEDGKEIKLMPGSTGNFKNLAFLKVGGTYNFTVNKKTFNAGLTHYILIDAK